MRRALLARVIIATALIAVVAQAPLTEDSAAAAPGVLTLTAPASATITEAGGSTTLQVTRTGGSTGAVGATILVAGTAGAGERTVSPLSVSFADGDTAPKTVTVTAIDDLLDDGNKTVILALTGATGGASLDPGTQTVTIIDDDGPGQLTLTAPTSAQIAEGGGSTTLQVTRTGGSTGAVGATISVGGTAGAGERTVSPLSVSFANGDTAPKTVTVTAIGDLLNDGDKTVILSLTGGTGGAILDPGTQTVTILDGTVPGQLSLTTPASAQITEAGGSTTLQVTRTGGSTGAVGATISVAGTAGAGERTVSPLSVSFANGDTAPKTVTVTAIGDLLNDGDKTVVLSLTGTTGGASLDPGSRTVTIVDATPQPALSGLAPTGQRAAALKKCKKKRGKKRKACKRRARRLPA